jgi:ribosomal protein L24
MKEEKEEINLNNIGFVIATLIEDYKIQQEQIKVLESKLNTPQKQENLSSKDIQIEYKVSKSKIDLAKKEGRLKFFKNGRSTRYKRKDVNAWFYGNDKGLID